MANNTLQRYWEPLRQIFKSPQFRKSLRIAVASAGGNIFVFYSIFSDYLECFLGIYIYLVLVIVSQSDQVGGVIQAGIRYCYIASISSLLAIIAVGIAQGSGVGLYFVTLVEFFLVSLLRLDPKVRGYGISTFFLLGPTLMESVGLHLSECWQTIYATLLSAILASFIGILSSLIIFPETLKSTLRRRVSFISSQMEQIIVALDSQLFVISSDAAPKSKEALSYVEPTTKVQFITPVDKKQTPEFLSKCHSLWQRLWKSLLVLFDDPTLRPLSVALDDGDGTRRKLGEMSANIRDMKRFVDFLIYEPTVLPPWQCEPRDKWMPILVQFEQLIAHLESLNEVVRRHECFSAEYLSENFRIPTDSMRQAFLQIKERLHHLNESFRQRRFGDSDDLDFNSEVFFKKIYEEFAEVRQQMWKSDVFYEEKIVDNTFRYAALAFIVFELRAAHENVNSLEKAMKSFCDLYHQLRFSFWKNWTTMLNEMLLPFRGYLKVWSLMKDPENVKYIAKFMLAIAIIEFPPMFVAQFSRSAKDFMRNENDIYVLIYVAILFWQSKELSVFRSILYCVITFASSALAYAATAFTPHHVYGLTLWLFLWTFVGLLIGTSFPAYIMGTFPLALAQYGIISCDYGKYTFTYVASRTVCVCIACGIVFTFSVFIWPYSVALKCRKMLSGALRLVGKLTKAEVAAFQKTFVPQEQHNGSDEGVVSSNNDTPSSESDREDAVRVGLETNKTERKQTIQSVLGTLLGVRMLVTVELTPNYRRSSIPTLVDVIGFCVRRGKVLSDILDMNPLYSDGYSSSMYPVFTNLMQGVESCQQHMEEILSFCSHYIVPPSKKREDTKELKELWEKLREDKRFILFQYISGRQRLFLRWREQRMEKLQQNNFDDPIRHPFVCIDDSFRFHAWLYAYLDVVDGVEVILQTVLRMRNSSSG
eukprot:jgi/Galph1/297/GphlegSOOS_G5082.1